MIKKTFYAIRLFTKYSQSCRKFLHFILQQQMENLDQQEIHKRRDTPTAQQEGLETSKTS